jgi:hypothetical protein
MFYNFLTFYKCVTENLTYNTTVCDFPRSEFDAECDTLLISNKMKNNLKSLLLKYPDGMLCSELPQLYKVWIGINVV